MKQKPEIKITVLLENTSVHEGLECEHGLSFFIEAGADQIVFDTGQSGLFIHNAQKLGIDLSTVGSVVLSHGHYDHTGGLVDLCECAPGVTVYCHPLAAITRYSIGEPAQPRSIGMPWNSLLCLKYRMFVETGTSHQIGRYLYVTGTIPRENNYEDTGGPFYLDPEGQKLDEIMDDQAMWFICDKGLVIILGCAHAGVINTIRYCQMLSGIKRVHALIGGFHLIHAGEERMMKTIIALREVSPDVLAACHCTGEAAVQRMSAEFPAAFRACGGGSVFCFKT